MSIKDAIARYVVRKVLGREFVQKADKLVKQYEVARTALAKLDAAAKAQKANPDFTIQEVLVLDYLGDKLRDFLGEARSRIRKLF